jgi:hypothetical protein
LFFRIVPSANTLVRWVNENAFAPIVRARPCPTFGRPVRHWGSPHRLRPGTSPHALRIPPRGGHPALQSPASGGSRSALAVSGFRLRARLGFSIPSTHSGRRGVTPAFGYGAPHPGAGGTSTLLTSALPSAHYEPVRLPASARSCALVVLRASPPSATSPTDPAGSPGSQRWPFAREAVRDPGGATPSRISTAHMWPSLAGTSSASTIFTLSRLITRTPCNPCLRFGPRVTATPARLGSGLPATALTGRDFHSQVTSSSPSALPLRGEFRWPQLPADSRLPL